MFMVYEPLTLSTLPQKLYCPPSEQEPFIVETGALTNKVLARRIAAAAAMTAFDLANFAESFVLIPRPASVAPSDGSVNAGAPTVELRPMLPRLLKVFALPWATLTAWLLPEADWALCVAVLLPPLLLLLGVEPPPPPPLQAAREITKKNARSSDQRVFGARKVRFIEVLLP